MRATRMVFVAGVLAALAARLLLLRAFSGNYDVESFAGAVAILRRGGALYLETARYNYSPVWAHVLLALDALARGIGCSLGAVLGAFLLVVDALTSAVLYRLGGGGRRGGAAAVLFFLNPVSVFVSSFHLQFDNVAILLLLCALLWARRLPATRGATVAWLSASLLVKHITAFFPPLFLASRRERGLKPLAAAVPYAVFAASFLPYWRSWEGVRQNVLGYRSLSEDYGVAMLLALPGVPRWVPGALFAAAVLVALALLRAVPRERACLMLFLVMLLFAPGHLRVLLRMADRARRPLRRRGIRRLHGRRRRVLSRLAGRPRPAPAPPAGVARRVVEPAAVAAVGGAPSLDAP